jgi:predicted lipoprotein with Yx(FWY)xxD motif
MTAANARLGTIVVDHGGMTLYTLTNNGKAVACTGQCASFWPPLTVPNGTTPTGGAGTGTLGTTAAANGSLQVTINGLPVYRFSGDSGPGMTNGQGIQSFGGLWQVVKAGASAAAGAGAGNAAPTGSVPGY